MANSPSVNRAETQLTNRSSSRSLTSEITPPPNWAGRPVIDRSVSTWMSVMLPVSVKAAVTSAVAVPLPRRS